LHPDGIIKRKRDLLHGLFKKGANGKNWELDRASPLFRQTMGRYENTNAKEGVSYLPRCLMLEKFTSTGEALVI